MGTRERRERWIESGEGKLPDHGPSAVMNWIVTPEPHAPEATSRLRLVLE